MGCPSECTLGDNLVFSICTHDPDTGQITDADSAPAYRVYEDETTTPILTGTMAKLDDDNTTGFYTELIACTAANGFEDGKNYTIYIQATVDSDTVGICYGFKTTAPTSGAGDGAYTGTLTIDDGSTGLEGAIVNVTRGGVLKASGTTDADGQITSFVFGAYTYTIAVRLADYESTTSTLTVSGDAWSKTISLTALTITPPSSVSLCKVQFRVKIGDTALEGAVCRAKLIGTNVAADGVVLSNDETSDTTDSDGIAELELVREDVIVKGSKLYGIWVTYNNIQIAHKVCVIPAQSTVLFEDLL